MPANLSLAVKPIAKLGLRPPKALVNRGGMAGETMGIGPFQAVFPKEVAQLLASVVLGPARLGTDAGHA